MNTVQEPLNGHRSPSFFKSVISKLKPQHDSDALGNEPSDKLKPDRCQFTFSDGRQCRHPAKVYPQDELSPVKKVRNQRASLCAHHSSKQAPSSPAAPGLEALCGDLTTATNINRALAQTFLLLAQGRISRRDAVAFGYLSQLLLQTVPGIRAEFVAAFGYHPWADKLKTSLTSNSDEDREPPDGGENDQSERGVPARSPINNISVNEQPSHDPAPFPDYESIVSRSRDLFDGKYDTTPEGRREARALHTELELMKPPASKPPKGARASVIEHMKRWIAQRKGFDSKTASAVPPPLNNLGHPIRMAVPPPLSADERGAPRHAAFQKVSEKPLPSPAPQPPALSSELRPTPRPKHLQDSAGVPAPERPPSPCQSPAALAPDTTGSPACAVFARAGVEATPDQMGHRTDWYAPASWSKTGKPDPFPSRAEKSARKLRGMSNYRFRHLQHLNSRGF